MANKIWCFVLLFLLLFTTFFTASAFRFKSSGSTITVPDDFPTIQAAVDNASDGDTIFIRAGVYNESITVNKTLTFLGENRSTTTIVSWLLLYANDTTIDGLTVEHLALYNVSNTVVQDSAANITAYSSYNSTFSRNNLGQFDLYYCSQFSITDNVLDFGYKDFPGLRLYFSSNNTISKNTIANATHVEGTIFLDNSTNNAFFENDFMNDLVCIWFVYADNNTFYHNNFKNFTAWAYLFRLLSVGNVFDAGYPAGGNYYSTGNLNGGYSGKDFFSGPYQNETGSDGIGDTPFLVGAIDNYPLMKPYSGPHDIGVLIKASKTTIAQGYNASVVFNATVINYGMQSEDSNFTFDMLGTNYETALSVKSRNSTVYQYILDTTGFTLGNYTVWAYVSPVSGETDTSDNNFTLTIRVVIPGDVSSTTPGVPDGTVNMKDIAYMVSLFNTKPNSVNWDPNADVNNDGVCNMRDIAIAVAYFNQHE